MKKHARVKVSSCIGSIRADHLAIFRLLARLAACKDTWEGVEGVLLALHPLFRPSLARMTFIIWQLAKPTTTSPGRPGVALKVFHRLHMLGLAPDTRCYYTALQACLLAKDWRQAWKLNATQMCMGPRPDAQSFLLLLHALGLSSRTDMVMRTLDAIGALPHITFDSVLLRASLSALAKCGAWRLAETIMRTLVSQMPGLGHLLPRPRTAPVAGLVQARVQVTVCGKLRSKADLYVALFGTVNGASTSKAQAGRLVELLNCVLRAYSVARPPQFSRAAALLEQMREARVTYPSSGSVQAVSDALRAALCRVS